MEHLLQEANAARLKIRRTTCMYSNNPMINAIEYFMLSRLGNINGALSHPLTNDNTPELPTLLIKNFYKEVGVTRGLAAAAAAATVVIWKLVLLCHLKLWT